MNPTGKKFISLLIVFFLLEISCTTITSPTMDRKSLRKRSANLAITKTDGQQVRGELIAVKMNTLLLIDTNTEKDISINVREIKFIKVGRKSKILQGIGIGLSIGSFSGMLIGATKKINGGDEGIPLFLKIILPFLLFVPNPDRMKNSVNGLLIGGSAGLLIGTFFGVVAEKNSHIQIEGMTDSEIQETLNKLRKKARIRNYK